MPPPFTVNGANTESETPGSGQVTPWEDRAPRFAHECVQRPPSEDEPAQPPEVQQRSSEEDKDNSVDLNDPSIEDFPRERHLILERVKISAARLSEDETVWQSLSQCPAAGGDHQAQSSEHSEQSESSSLPPGRVAGEGRTPSLDSIPEEHAYAGEGFSALPGSMHAKHDQSEFEGLGYRRNEQLATHREEPEPPANVYEPNSAGLQPITELTQNTVPTRTSVCVGIQGTTCESRMPCRLHPDSRDISARQTMDGAHVEEESLQSLPTNPDSSNQAARDTKGDGELGLPGEWSSAINEQSLITSSLRARSGHISDPSVTGSAGSGLSSLTNRKAVSPLPERPFTPNSMRSVNLIARSRELLETFLRLIFVDWVGGMIKRLCGRVRRAYATPPLEPLQ